MKTYIMMFGIANIVAGGTIYCRNKIVYLKERGWRVIVFPFDDGDVYIRGLEEYAGCSYSFLLDFPAEYPLWQRNHLLDVLQEKIPSDSDNLIIETGTDYNAYWGELLAKRIGAKHFIFFLDEKNSRLNQSVMPFYEYKYERRELACITQATMVKMFSGYKELEVDKAYGLMACCTNSIEDYESEFCDILTRCDYNIGSVGRLEKEFVPTIIQGICSFAEIVYPKRVMVCLFGGSDNWTIQKVRREFEKCNNVNLYISGYIWPLPLKAIKKCDMFISGAGGARATAHYGIPTLAMDVYHNRPVGIITDTKENYFTSDAETNMTVLDYLKQILVVKDVPFIETNKSYDEWKVICLEYDKHMQFITNFQHTKEWYPVEKMNLSLKQKIKKIIRFFLGIKGFKTLKKILNKK